MILIDDKDNIIVLSKRRRIIRMAIEKMESEYYMELLAEVLEGKEYNG